MTRRRSAAAAAPLFAVLLFTAPDGAPVFIIDAQVAAVSRAPHGVCDPAAAAIIDTLAKSYCVREAPIDIAKALGWKR